MKRYKIMTVTALLALVIVTGAFAGLTPPQAGDTQLFNVFGQGFFSGYYPISATLQDMNEQTYIFVEDAAINDIALNPNDDNMILLATESGALYSADGGQNWTHVNGAIADDFLPEGYRTGGGSSADQHRVRLESAYFFDDADWMVGAGGGHLAFGDVVNFGPYRSKNGGDKWSSASSGFYSYTYEAGSGSIVSDRASIYEMIDEPGNSNNFFAATESGVLMFAKRKWKTWTSDGFPQITAEWAHFPVYDIMYDDVSQVLTAATELGLYQGTVDFDEEQVSWEPLGTNPVPIIDVSTYIDSSYEMVDVVTYDTTTVVFSDSVAVRELADGFLVTVDGIEYTVFDYTVTVNSIELINMTITPTEVLTVEIVSPRVYFDADGILTPNQWVTIVDASTEMRWVGKARNIGGEWYVELNGENNYFANYTLIDPDTVDYQTYLPSTSDMSILPSSDVSYNSLTSDGNLWYLSTADGIYTYGDSLAYLSETQGLVVNDLLFSGTVYAGTASGLYKLTSDATWTSISPILTDGYSGEGHEYAVAVNSIAVDGAGNLYFAGPLGGLYKSTDAGASWTTLNKGLTNRNVTLDQVASFKASITSDVYNTLTNWFGSFPDVDGDNIIYTLIADLSDQFYSSQGDGVTSVRGDFYALDQFDPADSMAANSNFRDLILIDNNPQSVDSPGAAEQAAFQLTRMISFKGDADEEDWIVNGLSGLGAFLTGLHVSSDLTVYTNNSLTIWGDVVPAQRDFDHTFIFMEYLYEHYLTDATAMQAFVADELNGLESLANQGLSDTFTDIYKNFSLAIHLDGTVDSNGNIFGEGMYDFANLNIGHGGSIIDWGFTGGDSPYTFTTRENSVSYFVTDGVKGGLYWAPGLGDNVVFNVDDNSVSRIFLLQTGTAVDGVIANYNLTELTLDDQNIGTSVALDDFDKSASDLGLYNQLNMMVITYEAGTANGGGLILHDELTTPNMLELSIAQSGVFPQYIDVFGFSDTRIYDDGGMKAYYNTDDDPSTAELEGPMALITSASGDTVAYETLAHYQIDDALGIFAYRSSFDLNPGETASNYSISLKGESSWGGQISSTSLDVVAVITQPGQETILSSADDNALLRLAADATVEPSMITIISNDNTPELITGVLPDADSDNAVSKFYQIGPSGKTVPGANSLTLSFDPSKLEASDIVNVFRLESDKWVEIESDVSYNLGEATISFDEYGSYQVRKGGSQPITTLPSEFALHGNFPNPFNPSTTIRYDIPSDSNVRVLIYNVLGQEIATLVNQVQTAGYYSVQWNGLSSRGTQVGSGLYFVRLMTDHGQFNHKMVYMK